jgi:hypothetical protein
MPQITARARLRPPSLVVAGLLCALTLGGCVAERAYVDVGSARASLHQITAVPTPVKVQVRVQSLRNGDPYPANDAALREQVEAVLRATGAMQPVTSGAQATLHVVADDEYNVGGARLKGVLVGVTQGFAGKTVTDDWKISFSLVGAGIHPYAGDYDHSVLTTFGHKLPPIAGPAQTEGNAYTAVVQQSTIDFLWDWQQAMRDGPTPVESGSDGE